MLDWSAEQVREVTVEHVELEFTPTTKNVERGVPNSEFVLRVLVALTSCEAKDIVANSRKNPLETWRRLQKRCVPTTGRRTRNLLRTIISPGRCSRLGLRTGTGQWGSCVSRCEKKLKETLDDEMKLAALEALMPEERGAFDTQLEPLANV